MKISYKLILAEASYKEAVRLSPGNPHNRLCLGRIYEKQGKLAQAESEYRILAEASPAYADQMARICEKLGKTTIAIEEYEYIRKYAEFAQLVQNIGYEPEFFDARFICWHVD